jgi:hypothetical protein
MIVVNHVERHRIPRRTRVVQTSADFLGAEGRGAVGAIEDRLAHRKVAVTSAS